MAKKVVKKAASSKGKKWVYTFGNGKAEGKADMKNLLGGKGANLAEMSNIGIPVPPGFTVTTEVCTYFYANKKTYPKELKDQVLKAVAACEKIMKKKFGDVKDPLLFSVRSGARVSMPGMMDTVLNLGLTDQTIKGLIAVSGNEWFAYDSYRRFLQMYSNVVLGADHDDYEHAFEALKKSKGYKSDTDMKVADLKALIETYKAIGKKQGKIVPQDPMQQLWGGIGAVFNSWMIKRAQTYRKLNNIPEDWGTAVNVQAMVFGNSGDNSATGVCFSRDPATGENLFYGEYLKNAQGEDVVAGIRTPQPMTKIAKQRGKIKEPCMEEEFPKLYKELYGYRTKLEKHYRDMQDMEFTIQDGKLWMLQTRNGKRTAASALKIAVDMVKEKLIDKNTAVLRVDPASLDSLLHPMLDPKANKKVIAKGLPASPGAAVGKAVFSADDAEKWVNTKKEKVVLCRIETSPEDIGGMHVSQGVLTTRGGMTSHAAVVARGMGTPCVSGAGDIHIDYAKKQLSAGGVVIKEGDMITIDGSTGQVIAGAVPMIPPQVTGDFAQLMKWADEVRDLQVRTNAETPSDAAKAVEFGAQGIGLARTEHMFFDPARIGFVRQMILADNEADRVKALDKLLPFQKKDFVDLFKVMAGLPVTVRLLDPPLHEFLPTKDSEIAELAKAMKVDAAKIKARVTQLHELNPMLGHRGCRLGVTYPEIYAMQAKAIFEAAAQVSKGAKKAVEPEVMIPLISTKKELDLMKAVVVEQADAVMKATKTKIKYTVGTMIELPRAAIMAGEIAETAEFFSFGTNDLTQTTLGMSRDDAGNFLPEYVDKGIYARDPFAAIDQDGVGFLIKLAVDQGRKTKPGMKMGICGEHGGEPSSVEFCHRAGLTYVSCSPFRVPLAKLAAAHAALKFPRKASAAKTAAKKPAAKKAPAKKAGKKRR